MAEKSSSNKGCKKSRKPGAQIANYWNMRHPRNMFRRAKRVFKKYSGYNPLNDHVARREAQKCASAHGPLVEGMLARWLRGEKPF